MRLALLKGRVREILDHLCFVLCALSWLPATALLVACPTHKKTTTPTSLPGLRVTGQGLCALSYSATLDVSTASVTRRYQEKEREQTAKGLRVGEATLFFGADLFEVPAGCDDAEISVKLNAAPRFQVSSSLAPRDDDGLYQASSPRELLQSLWVLGRETELRMLEGAFTAVFIGEAQDLTASVSSWASALEELFGAPVERQLLVIGALPSKSVGRNALLDARAKDFAGSLLRSLASLWLNTDGARAYYVSLLRYKAGEISPEDFIKDLSQDKVAARFFCLDVVSRSRQRSLAEAIGSMMRAGQPMTEKNLATELGITACSGDGLKIAASAAGLSVSQREVKLVKRSALDAALGL